MVSLRTLPFASLCSLLLLACVSDEEVHETGPAASQGDPSESSYEEELINAEKNGKTSQKWIYNGSLPKLDKAEVVASLKSHTVRVTGLLPKSFSGTLPFYVEVKPVGDRQKLTVVKVTDIA